MAVDPVFVLEKVEIVKTDLVYDYDVDNQVITMRVEDLVVKMVVEINELQVVAISYVHDINDETVERVDLSKVDIRNLKHFSIDSKEHHTY